MGENQNVQLTASEIASLWTAYMNDSMSICFLSYFLETVEDEEIRPIITMALGIITKHLTLLKTIFDEEGLMIPNGFSEQDVHLDAPRLYTDAFMLTYINQMGKVGLLGYSSMISMSARKDIRQYFRNALNDIADLFDSSTDLLLEKGLFVRSPYVPYPQKTDFVDSKSYLSGFSLFNKQRPINTVEISHLYMNIQTNLIGTKLALSFAQVSPKEEVQKFMLTGKDIAKKHIKIFSAKLIDNDVQSPISADISITDSTIPPFSDKLMMFHFALLSAAGIGNYATAAAASQRSDLVLEYERLSLEIAQYTKDGANIMINNKWLEQPPGTLDKEKLAKNKKEGH
ncbi:DUF3231 family protein [Sutcliffiella horikoshii]|uniref:DUF3231 family protein n=1 Tax=Sutcliffiella horikoshii TaxID=79883 RepID=UPI00384CA478